MSATQVGFVDGTPGGPATLDRPAIDPSLVAAAGPHSVGRRRPGWPPQLPTRLPPWWPLAAVLLAQAVRTVWLLRINTAFLDEATYLTAGREQLRELSHGLAGPSYSSYFSGAPFGYPVLAALIDHVAGLTGVRLFSGIAMLGVTACLYDVTRRLFDADAAGWAIALFAGLGPTGFLADLATFDAPALCGLALATMLVVQARDRPRHAPFLIIAGAVLGLANATKYASALFDPVVLALAFLLLRQPLGRDRAVRATAGMAGVTAVPIGLLLLTGGHQLIRGLTRTTLDRPAGTDAPAWVFQHSAAWIGVLLIVAAAGIVVRRFDPDRNVPISLLAVLVGARLLAPLNQARIHTMVALLKHVDFGAWFAAPVAGYAVAWWVRRVGRPQAQTLFVGVLVAIMVLPVWVLGARQTKHALRHWPDSTRLVQQLRPLVAQSDDGSPYLVENSAVAAYYLGGAAVPWFAWNDTFSLHYTDPRSHRELTGLAAYRSAIAHDYYAFVVLDYSSTNGTDRKISAALHRNPDYRLHSWIEGRDSVGRYGYAIWVRVRHSPSRVPTGPVGPVGPVGQVGPVG